MEITKIDVIHNNIQIISAQVQKLADELTHAYELDPDFTLIEMAKIHSSLLNISSKIYILHPELIPKHLQDCNWNEYIPK